MIHVAVVQAEPHEARQSVSKFIYPPRLMIKVRKHHTRKKLQITGLDHYYLGIALDMRGNLRRNAQTRYAL